MGAALMEAGVLSQERIEKCAAEMEEQGYFILEDALSSGVLQEARQVLDELFVREAEIGTLRGWHTDTYLVSYLLPQKSAFFRQFPLNPKALPIMRRILGANCMMVSLNGYTTTPGGVQQALHIDQAETVPCMATMINSMFCLDHFTVANGATRVVPGSHKRLFSKAAAEAAEGEAIQLTAPAGSLISFNGALWHGGSRNATERYRRAIHAAYGRAWIKPQWDYDRSLTPDVIESMTDDQRRIFGLDHTVKYYDPHEDAVCSDPVGGFRQAAG